MTDQNQKKRTGMASLAAAGEGEDFSVIDAIGGPRGVIESMLPGVLFVVLFVVTSNLNLTIGVSAALAVLQVVIRLVQRQSVMGALSGLIAVGICLIWAWQSHEARNYYMFGFLTNAVYIVLLSFTLLIRVPGLGLMVEFIRTIPTEHFRAWLHGWLDDKPLRRAYTIVTVLWIGVFALRLIVQVPLYLADSVALLGTARLLMGIPFWALAIWVSYLIIATPLHRHIAAAKAAAGGGKDGDSDGHNSGDEGDNAAGQADPVKSRKETMNAQVRIERYADQGRCVGHIDGRVVFVRFALPGELVQVALDEPHDRDDRLLDRRGRRGHRTEPRSCGSRMAAGRAACHGWWRRRRRSGAREPGRAASLEGRHHQRSDEPSRARGRHRAGGTGRRRH